MSKGITIEYQRKQIRATICEQQIWFSCLDIQEIIDIGSMVLYPEETAEINVDGCVLQMINEFGVYRLSSTEFRKWLIGDAIIRLRKYGCYKLSVAEEKERIISELSEKGVDVKKLKHYSLDKLRAYKIRTEKEFERQEREREISSKRIEAINDFPFSQKDLENEFDIGLAIKDLRWNKENLDEYMVRIRDDEWRFNGRFVRYIKNGNYEW